MSLGRFTPWIFAQMVGADSYERVDNSWWEDIGMEDMTLEEALEELDGEFTREVSNGHN